MNKGICIAVPSTVTISTEEYTELVTSRAYLSVIMEAQASDKGYVVDNVVEIISRLTEPVITGAEPSSDGSEVETDA